MKLGVFAKTFAGTDPLTVLSASRAAGFETVQYNMSCSGIGSLPEAVPDDIAYKVRDAVLETGAGIAAISATYNMTDPDPDSLAAGRRAFLAICEQAGAIGSNLVTVCSGSKHPKDKWQHHPANDDPQSWTEMCREFESICEQATQHGVLIGVEPEPANIVRDADRAACLIADFAGGPIRIVLDPANIIDGVAPERHRRVIDHALDLLGDHLALAHAKDRHADGTVAPAGRGTVDWARFLSGLSATGFGGALVAHGMAADDAPAVARFLADQLERL